MSYPELDLDTKKVVKAHPEDGTAHFLHGVARLTLALRI